MPSFPGQSRGPESHSQSGPRLRRGTNGPLHSAGDTKRGSKRGNVMKRLFLLILLLFAGPLSAQPAPAYFSHAGHDDAWSGGGRVIPIYTPPRDLPAWAQRGGNKPR